MEISVEKYLKKFNEFISYNDISQNNVEAILQETKELFFLIESKKFSTILKTKILTDLIGKINEINNTILRLPNSRSKIEIKKKLFYSKSQLNNLLINLYENYSEYFENEKNYQDYLSNKIQQIEILTKSFLEADFNQSVPFPEYYNKNESKKIIDEILNYYKTVFYNPSNFTFVYTKLTKLSESIKTRLNHLESIISLLKINAENHEKNLANNTEEIDYTRNEYYSIVNELDNSSKYHEDLIEFNNILIKEYPFINASPIIITKKITVFGDSNLEVIKRIFSEYSDFISSSIQEEEFIQNFLIDAPISNKIKLINGTLSDYAYLIREIKPFFIEKYQEATIYNQWWSDRFLFSNKEKNRRDISNMVSALNNDRQATKTSAVKNIVAFLKSSYKHPTLY